MRKVFWLLLLPAAGHAQINWRNYSTSFQGSGKEGVRPTLVTAIPYNGRYDNGSYSSIFTGKQPAYIGKAYTYDSADVYFLAPGLHPANADRYEFRVTADSSKSILPWSPVTRFTDKGIALNEFKDRFGFLGGYHADWGHSIQVYLREKASGVILAATSVCWTRDRPHVVALYTAGNLTALIGSRKDSSMERRLDQLRNGTLTLGPGDNTLIFYLGEDLYRDSALEYQLLRNGSVMIPWQKKAFDNSKLLLQDLKPGSYTLQLRLRAQRHHVSTYSFTILPAWYESKLFRIMLGGLATIAVLAPLLLFTLIRQRRRSKRERSAHDQLNLDLRAIRAQLNPHFIFNALSSIQGLINNNDTDGANRYLSEFAHLLRESLAAGDTTSLQHEIVLLDTYLKLEQLRFGFQYSIDTAADVTADTEIPAFLLQPLVENAVKHGVSSLRNKGRITLRFSRENTTFIARISDNGQGWDPNRPSTGYGLKLTRERIRLLNQFSRIELIIDHSTAEIRFSNWWT